MPPKNTSSPSLVSGTGAFAGFLAFVGASCCVLPILLVQLGVASGLVARLGWFTRWQTEISIIAGLLLAVALAWALWKGRPSRGFWIWWALGAVFLLVAFILPHYEPQLQRWLLDSLRR